MATIRKHRGKWQAIVKRKGQGTKSKSFHIKQDAQKWARMQEFKFNNGTFGKLLPHEVTLEELLIRYREAITITKKGAPQEIRRIQRLLKDPLATLTINQITSSGTGSLCAKAVSSGMKTPANTLVQDNPCSLIAKLIIDFTEAKIRFTDAELMPRLNK